MVRVPEIFFCPFFIFDLKNKIHYRLALGPGKDLTVTVTDTVTGIGTGTAEASVSSMRLRARNGIAPLHLVPICKRGLG